MNVGRLGEYLRARRAQLKPQDVGFAADPHRRVPGLRREEVAILAGISPEYYVRLEQGRDVNPSAQIVTALARALCLDDEATAYLGILSGRTISRHGAHRHGTAEHREHDETANPDIQTMIDTWPLTAAYVQGRTFTVLAANSLATRLRPHFDVGANPMRAAFLAPDMRELYRDWDHMTTKAVAFLRSSVATKEDDPAVDDLVEELRAHSPQFRTLWARHDVKIRDRGDTLFRHPKVGSLDLRFQKFILPESEAVLVTYHARPGSPSEASLQTLADMDSVSSDI